MAYYFILSDTVSNKPDVAEKLTNHIPTVNHSLLKCPKSYREAIKSENVYCRDNTVPLKNNNVRIIVE